MKQCGLMFNPLHGETFVRMPMHMLTMNNMYYNNTRQADKLLNLGPERERERERERKRSVLVCVCVCVCVCVLISKCVCVDL